MAKGYSEALGFNYNEEERNNVFQMSDFKLITGGKEPPTGNCWLDEHPIGSILAVEDKLATDIRQPNYFNLGIFKIAGRDGKLTYLQSLENPKGEPVNPVRFCNRFNLYLDITGYIVAKEQEEVDHERNRVQGDPGIPSPEVE